jgi:hypothetical protein
MDAKKLALIRRIAWLIPVLIGVVFLAAGAFMYSEGRAAKNDVRAALVDEQVKTGKDGVQFGVAEGTLVSDAKSARAQADTIKLHSSSIKGEVLKSGQPTTLHYATMTKDLFVDDTAYTNARNTYLNGVTLRTALHLSELGFQVSDLVMGIGAFIAAVGATFVLIFAPAVYWSLSPAAEATLVTAIARAPRHVPEPTAGGG